MDEPVITTNSDNDDKKDKKSKKSKKKVKKQRRSPKTLSSDNLSVSEASPSTGSLSGDETLSPGEASAKSSKKGKRHKKRHNKNDKENDADLSDPVDMTAAPPVEPNTEVMESYFEEKLVDRDEEEMTSGDMADAENSIANIENKTSARTSGSIWEKISIKLGHIKDSIRSSPTLDNFKTDHVVMLTNKVSGKVLRVTDFDEIDCKGSPDHKHDEQLHFLVTNYGWNIVSLKSMTFPLLDDKFLCVKQDGKLYSDGAMKNNECRFRIHETQDNCVTFESYVSSKHHIAFDQKGNLIPPDEMPGKEECTHFHVKVICKQGEQETSQAWDVMH